MILFAENWVREKQEKAVSFHTHPCTHLNYIKPAPQHCRVSSTHMVLAGDFYMLHSHPLFISSPLNTLFHLVKKEFEFGA